MGDQQQQERKHALLVRGNELGEVLVRGIFDSHSEAEEYADEELGSEVVYEIQGARYY